VQAAVLRSAGTTEALEVVCLRALDPCNRTRKVHAGWWSRGWARSCGWVQAAMLHTAAGSAAINVLRLETLDPCSRAMVGGACRMPATSMLRATCGGTHNVIRMWLCEPRCYTLESQTSSPGCRWARGCCWVQAAMLCSAGTPEALEVVCLRAFDPCGWTRKCHASRRGGGWARSCRWVQAAVLSGATSTTVDQSGLEPLDPWSWAWVGSASWVQAAFMLSATCWRAYEILGLRTWHPRRGACEL
jgi:hypothetical protein